MTTEEALATLEAAAEPGRAAQMAAYHKAPRRYLGVPNPALDTLATEWRRSLSLPGRIVLADGLWRSDIHEARIAAAKLLTQARIRRRRGGLDADRLLGAGFRRLGHRRPCLHGGPAAARGRACAARLRSRAGRVSPHLWTRRAALVITLPWTKQNHPSEAERAARDRVLGWAAGYVTDRDWFIQKAVAWWLRDLSKHDPERVRVFLAGHGAELKPFARKEASRYL